MTTDVADLPVSETPEQKEVEGKYDPKDPADFETAISHTGYGRFNYLLLLAYFPAYIACVFDTASMAYVLPLAECDLDLSNFDKGLLNGAVYMGMITSSFFWGFLSDKLGRRKLLVVGYTLDGISGVLMSLSPTFWLLLFFKFICGFILAGPFAVGVSFLAEFNSARYRSRMLMFTGVYVAIAQTMVPVLAMVFIPQRWQLVLVEELIIFTPWRCFLLICSMPSLMAAFCISFFDESPKFLMTSGKNEEALNVFRKIYQINTGKSSDTFPVKHLLDERKLRGTSTSEVAAANFKSPLYYFKMFWRQTKPLLETPHLPRALLIFAIQGASMLAMNTLRLWLPTLFATMQEFQSLDMGVNVSLCDILTAKTSHPKTNVTDPSEPCSLGAMETDTYLKSIIVFTTTGIVYLLASFLINIIGKKCIMIGGSGCAGVFGLALYWSNHVDLTLALVALYLSLGSISISAILSVVVDIFPTKLRTMAVSLTMMCGRAGSLLGNLMFPLFLDISCELPFLLISGMTSCACVLCFFLPRTTMKSLE